MFGQGELIKSGKSSINNGIDVLIRENDNDSNQVKIRRAKSK